MASTEGVHIEDVNAPNLKSYDLKSYDIVLTDSDVRLDATAVIEDDFSGLNHSSFNWESPSGNQNLYGGGAYEYVLTEGDINNGTYEFQTNEISRYAESGEWTLQYAHLQDKAQNYIHLNTEQLQELGIRTSLNISGVSEYLGPSSGPRAKNFDSGLVIDEGDIQSGLNFDIYSELVKVKDYEPSDNYPGYTFSAKDFEAIEVHYDFGSADSNASLEDGGITVDDAGNITIDTNSSIYQELYQGDKEEIHVAFSVTDDNNRSDNGLVAFEVLGAGPQAKDFFWPCRRGRHDSIGAELWIHLLRTRQNQGLQTHRRRSGLHLHCQRFRSLRSHSWFGCTCITA